MRFALAVLLLLVALPAQAQVDPKAKTMTTRELWEWAAKKSDVVLLGRVLAPVSDPRPDTNYAAYLGVQSVTARVEPIEWLKGKLDGEEIEVLHNWAVDRSDQRLRSIAGKQPHPSGTLRRNAGGAHAASSNDHGRTRERPRGQAGLPRVARRGFALGLLEGVGDQAHDGFPSSSRMARPISLPERWSRPAT